MIFNDFKFLVKKIIGRHDAHFLFQVFEREINPDIINNFSKYTHQAQNDFANRDSLESASNYLQASPIIKQGHRLIEAAKADFANKYQHLQQVRFLVHVPTPKLSPGGFSLFNNFLQAVKFLGVEARAYYDTDNLGDVLTDFQPSYFLTSDSETYLNKINWSTFSDYRKSSPCQLGLTASLEEYGNTPLSNRLAWAKKNGIDFYYSFRSIEYLTNKAAYQDFYKAGYKIYNIEFGANILQYYPVPGIKADLDFIFLGSSNFEEYVNYFPPIFKNYRGFVAGIGWRDFTWVDQNIQRYLYAHAKIGLNISGAEHRRQASELTERTYILAAMGIPQLVDNPLLLPQRFSSDMLFSATNPDEYLELFKYILSHPAEAEARALKAQQHVLANYTNFHRVESFLKQLIKGLS